MMPRTYNLLIRGIALAISVVLFIGAMLFLSSVFHMDVLGDLTLLFNEPASYGEWEAVETIDGVEHVFSSAAGDDPKEVLSPVSYWLGFRGGMALILVVFAAIFAYAIGRAVVSAVIRMKNRTQTVYTEVKNGTLVDTVSDSFHDYVEKCKEGMETNAAERGRDTYIFGKKYVKGDRKSTIRLVLLLVLIAAVVAYFVVLAVI